MFQILVLLAEGDNAAPPPGGGLMGFVPFILIAVVAWFLLIRPMKRQEQERQAMVSSLKKNDKVLTTSGIYGTVVGISETEDEITVKVDDNVRLRMLKSSVARNLTNEEAAKAAKTTKEGAA
jgi:preprotein translocase subunit YajC